MSHKHQTLLRAIFHDPLPANVHWRELESLLSHLGATFEPSHGARFKVTLNQASDFLHHPHHNSECSRDLVKQVREFLTQAGVSLSSDDAAKD
ncbi:MAG: hypothetical protein A3F78_18880 [Burkholderiales bacterium RIFCSPLOWO2_12_FULL_61_40]|nr:MAG: hypothetical protein A3F78_18880 [Burkholderiales bacterium RIFCSPLOWO2_12_FULL_61_40]